MKYFPTLLSKIKNINDKKIKNILMAKKIK